VLSVTHSIFSLGFGVSSGFGILGFVNPGEFHLSGRTGAPKADLVD
jgi:hypothetical protein